MSITAISQIPTSVPKVPSLPINTTINEPSLDLKTSNYFQKRDDLNDTSTKEHKAVQDQLKTELKSLQTQVNTANRTINALITTVTALSAGLAALGGGVIGLGIIASAISGNKSSDSSSDTTNNQTTS